MGPIEWMARNSIAANLLMILLLGGGLWMAVQVQKEIFPEAQLDVVEVEVTYPGAAPEEVEQGVLMPVEEAVQGVESIEEMVSTAREGSGVIQLELVAGANRMQALQDIEQAVDTISSMLSTPNRRWTGCAPSRTRRKSRACACRRAPAM